MFVFKLRAMASAIAGAIAVVSIPVYPVTVVAAELENSAALAAASPQTINR